MVEIGFSEHVDFDPSDAGYGFFNYDRYSSEIEKARGLFGKRLVIRKGVEVDYQKRFEHTIKDWLKGRGFDFVMATVHYVEGRIIDSRLVMHSDLRELYSAYFEEVTKSVESSLFDVVGHLDYITKCDDMRKQHRNQHYWEEIQTVLEEIIERRMYLEINSNLLTLKENHDEMIPNRKVIEEYIQRGGELFSVGSDAHSPTKLCCGIAESLDFLGKHDKRIKLLFS
jgi:histidinol-phosphatase (PHP family)